MKRLREEFAPRKPEVPQVTVVIPPASRYDALLPSGQTDDLQDEPANQIEAVTA